MPAQNHCSQPPCVLHTRLSLSLSLSLIPLVFSWQPTASDAALVMRQCLQRAASCWSSLALPTIAYPRPRGDSNSVHTLSGGGGDASTSSLARLALAGASQRKGSAGSSGGEVEVSTWMRALCLRGSSRVMH